MRRTLVSRGSLCRQFQHNSITTTTHLIQRPFLTSSSSIGLTSIVNRSFRTKGATGGRNDIINTAVCVSSFAEFMSGNKLSEDEKRMRLAYFLSLFLSDDHTDLLSLVRVSGGSAVNHQYLLYALNAMVIESGQNILEMSGRLIRAQKKWKTLPEIAASMLKTELRHKRILVAVNTYKECAPTIRFRDVAKVYDKLEEIRGLGGPSKDKIAMTVTAITELLDQCVSLYEVRCIYSIFSKQTDIKTADIVQALSIAFVEGQNGDLIDVCGLSPNDIQKLLPKELPELLPCLEKILADRSLKHLKANK